MMQQCLGAGNSGMWPVCETVQRTAEDTHGDPQIWHEHLLWVRWRSCTFLQTHSAPGRRRSGGKDLWKKQTKEVKDSRDTGNNRMVVLGGFAYILLGSLAPYAIRTQERANEALGIGIRLYHVIFIIYEILIIIDNRIENEEYFSPHKCSAIFSYTCRAALICVGRICPWWCRGAEWWRWGGRSQWWRPGSASHLALCRWSSHSSEDYPPPQLLGQLSYRFHSQIRSVLYRYLENWRGQDRMNPNWAN